MSEGRGYGEIEICLSGRVLQNTSQALAGLCVRLFSYSRRPGYSHRAGIKCIDGGSDRQEFGCQNSWYNRSTAFPEIFEVAVQVFNEAWLAEERSFSCPMPSRAILSLRRSTQLLTSCTPVDMTYKFCRSLGQGHLYSRRDLSKRPSDHAAKVLDALNKMDPSGQRPLLASSRQRFIFSRMSILICSRSVVKRSNSAYCIPGCWMNSLCVRKSSTIFV